MADSDLNARVVWKLAFAGNQYEFDPQRQLTLGRLRQIKQWYGPDLGRYLSFLRAFSELDPDAVACAIWICRRDAGEENVAEPNRMEDFSIGEALEGIDTVDSGGDPDGPPAEEGTAEATSTPSSMETRTASGSSTSGSSPTSAD